MQNTKIQAVAQLVKELKSKRQTLIRRFHTAQEDLDRKQLHMTRELNQLRQEGDALSQDVDSLFEQLQTFQVHWKLITENQHTFLKTVSEFDQNYQTILSGFLHLEMQVGSHLKSLPEGGDEHEKVKHLYESSHAEYLDLKHIYEQYNEQKLEVFSSNLGRQSEHYTNWLNSLPEYLDPYTNLLNELQEQWSAIEPGLSSHTQSNSPVETSSEALSEEAQSKLQEVEAAFSELKEQNDALSEELNTLLEKYKAAQEQSTSSEGTDQSDEIRALEEALNFSEQEKQALQEALDAAQAAEASSESDTSENAEAHQALLEENKALQEALDFSEQEKQAMQEALDAAPSGSDNTALESLEEEKQALQEALNFSEQEKQALQEALDFSEQEKQAMQETLDAQPEESNAEGAPTAEEYSVLQEQLSELQSKLGSLPNMEASLEALQAEKQSRKDQILSLIEEQNELKAKLEEARQNGENASNNEALEQELSQLKAQLEETQQSSEQTSEANEALKQDIVQLKAQLEEAQENSGDAPNTEQSQTVATLEAEKQSLAEQLEAHQKELEELKASQSSADPAEELQKTFDDITELEEAALSLISSSEENPTESLSEEDIKEQLKANTHESYKKNIVEVLKARFGKVPRSVHNQLKKVEHLTQMTKLLKLSATAEDLEIFQEALKSASKK